MKMCNLTDEQLCRLAKNGDNCVVEALVNNNIGFIKTIAKEESSQYRDSVEFDDLVQEGMIAFWKCIEKYDERIGVNFLTYAKPAIKNAMTDLVRKNLSFTFMEIESLDKCIETGEQRLWEVLVSELYSKTPESIILKAETVWEMYAALKCLECRERTYLLYRFGFEDDREHSIADTAFHFSLSESRAKSVEKSAIQKLRKLMGTIPNFV